MNANLQIIILQNSNICELNKMRNNEKIKEINVFFFKFII